MSEPLNIKFDLPMGEVVVQIHGGAEAEEYVRDLLPPTMLGGMVRDALKAFERGVTHGNE